MNLIRLTTICADALYVITSNYYIYKLLTLTSKYLNILLLDYDYHLRNNIYFTCDGRPIEYLDFSEKLYELAVCPYELYRLKMRRELRDNTVYDMIETSMEPAKEKYKFLIDAACRYTKCTDTKCTDTKLHIGQMERAALYKIIISFNFHNSAEHAPSPSLLVSYSCSSVQICEVITAASTVFFEHLRDNLPDFYYKIRKRICN